MGRSEVGKSEVEYLRAVWRGASGSGVIGEVFSRSLSSFFFQGERGIKGACGLDGEKGDKV